MQSPKRVTIKVIHLVGTHVSEYIVSWLTNTIVSICQPYILANNLLIGANSLVLLEHHIIIPMTDLTDNTVTTNLSISNLNTAPIDSPHLVVQSIKIGETDGGVAPLPRQSHTAIMTRDSKMIIFGGYRGTVIFDLLILFFFSSGKQYNNQIFEYDTQKNRWTQIPIRMKHKGGMFTSSPFAI